MLLGLAALPILWWLLRITPPSPKRIRFPAIRLLLSLAKEEETSARTPWWLLALRLALAALLVLALADPLWNPAARLAGGGNPLLIVIDNGWAAGPHWTERIRLVESLIDQARRGDRPVALAGTAPISNPPAIAPLSPGDTQAALRVLEPQPWTPDRAALTARLANSALQDSNPEIIWVSDGLDHDGAAAQFADDLHALADGSPVKLIEPAPDDTALIMLPPTPSGTELTVRLRRAHGGTLRVGTVRALADDGRLLSETAFTFPPGARETEALFDLPLEMRNRIAHLDIGGERSAGATILLDERWRRRTVGLVSGGSLEEAQPLLSDLYYVRRAIEPYAEIRTPQPSRDQNTIPQSAIQALISQPLSVLILADIGQVPDADRAPLAQWIEKGGTLVRFAGPRLARQADDFIPVPLRQGGRALGGALSWTTPQRLSPFDSSSPFFGLNLPDDVTVSRQVLAEPTATLAAHSWARLTDGTPLVTAATRGKGRLILFHVTANTDWSNLPLSGLYVDMLRRLIALTQSAAGAGGMKAATGIETEDARLPLAPVKTLDGFGTLGPPPVTAIALTGALLAAGGSDSAPDDRSQVDARHPPGFYGEPGSTQALNLTSPAMTLTPLGALPGLSARQGFGEGVEIRLKDALLALAFLVFLADCLATLFVMGHLSRPAATGLPRRTGALLVPLIVLILMIGHTSPVQAEQMADEAADETTDAFSLAATLETHLAYVITGNAELDELSRAGLSGLSDLLRQRTAAEPGDPIGVDVRRSELAFFPLLYWPIEPSQDALSPQALARVNAYMKQGGTILFDTRDQDRNLDGRGGPASEALRRVLTKLDIPELTPVPADHVLTKSFYLLQNFPGRWDGGQVWVEAPARGPSTGTGTDETSTSNDGVSAVIIASNDFAGAWARDAAGRPLFPAVPGGERQRELAARFGINLVMYALTGNYKADQVHVPALLERLGQ